MKFNIENYPGKYVMHCKTKEEAEDFLNYLHSIGRTWVGGGSYKNNMFWLFEEDTAYNFNEGSHCSTFYYEKNNYTILEWEDFMKETFTKADLKNGDFVKFDNDQIGVVIADCDAILLKNDVLKLSLYKDDMSHPCAPAFTIKAVKRPEGAKGCYWDAFNNLYGELVYDRERDTVVEMTMEEICAALGKNIKIVKE